MKTYRISPSGRRTALILLIGALIIWAFALWTFGSTLGWGAWSANVAEGLSISQLVPALLMLVLIIATPLVIWNILEEWGASYTPAEDGLRFASLGIQLTYPWESITALRRIDDDSDDPLDELVFNTNTAAQIRNPLLRFLHHQAYGRTKLPIYAGVADRDQLVAEIRERAALIQPGSVQPADAAAPKPGERHAAL